MVLRMIDPMIEQIPKMVLVLRTPQAGKIGVEPRQIGGCKVVYRRQNAGVCYKKNGRNPPCKSLLPSDVHTFSEVVGVDIDIGKDDDEQQGNNNSCNHKQSIFSLRNLICSPR